MPLPHPAAPIRYIHAERSRAQRATERITQTVPARSPLGRHLAAAQKLQAKIQALQVQLDEHRAAMLEHMQSENVDILSLANGCSCIRKIRHNWTYSPECERDQLALRDLQKWEQKNGTATDNPTIYVSLNTSPK